MLALLCAVPGPASAERADRDKPIVLEADQGSVDDAKQISVFTGNVVLTQGTLMIKADRMEVRRDEQGFQYGTAFGKPAYFREKRDGSDGFIEGWALRLHYDGKAERLELHDQARLLRGADEVRGQYISYEVRSEVFRVTGKAPGAEGAPSSGRVRAVIQPKGSAGGKDEAGGSR